MVMTALGRVDGYGVVRCLDFAEIALPLSMVKWARLRLYAGTGSSGNARHRRTLEVCLW